jgi:hypothetical protein
MVPPCLPERLRPAFIYENNIYYIYSLSQAFLAVKLFFSVTHNNNLIRATPAIPARMVRNMFLVSKAMAKEGSAAQK